jgi:hypothetical protein
MASDPTEDGPDTGERSPSTEELQEPSTEKAPDEEPKAKEDSEIEPSHQAVGIGVIDGPPADQHSA